MPSKLTLRENPVEFLNSIQNKRMELKLIITYFGRFFDATE